MSHSETFILNKMFEDDKKPFNLSELEKYIDADTFEIYKLKQKNQLH